MLDQDGGITNCAAIGEATLGVAVLSVNAQPTVVSVTSPTVDVTNQAITVSDSTTTAHRTCPTPPPVIRFVAANYKVFEPFG